MAGTRQSGGRNRKSTEVLRLAGTHRKDRHGDSPPADGNPIKPAHLGEHGSSLWDRVVRQYGSILGELDTEHLTTCCDLWECYRTCMDAALEDPRDNKARIAASRWFNDWVKSASLLGLNPTDRQRLQLPTKKAKIGVQPRKRA